MNVPEIRHSFPDLAQTTQKRSTYGNIEQQSQASTVTQQTSQRVDAQHGATEVITPSERDFFESLFPQASSEIRAHVTYQRSGIDTPSNVGSIVDRKG